MSDALETVGGAHSTKSSHFSSLIMVGPSKQIPNLNYCIMDTICDTSPIK